MAEENIERIAAYLDRLDIKVDVSNDFNSRLKVQKITYLLEKLFKSLSKSYEEPYKLDNFFFHAQGPYSKQLTRDYFDDMSAFKNTPKVALSGLELTELDRTKDLLTIASPLILEIMASLLFVKDELGDKGSDWENVEGGLKAKKPYLRDQDVWIAEERLKEFLLTEKEAKRLSKEIMDEMEPFDKVASEDFIKTGF